MTRPRHKYYMAGKERKIGKTVLSVIGAAGILSVALVAPNAVQALTIFGLGKKKYLYQRRYQVNKAIDRLKQKGMIELVQKGNKKFFRLTELGRKEFIKNELANFKPKKPKKWDKKWRIVIFDIKEYKRGKGDQLRKFLNDQEFVKLQNSVWVYPYECDELIFMLKTSYSLGKEVLYITADNIENDSWLKRKFNLVK